MNRKTSSIDRRTAIKTGAAAIAVIAAAGTLAKPNIARAQAEGPIKVPPLPYADDALAPVISANTIGFHYGKHHVGYATALSQFYLVLIIVFITLILWLASKWVQRVT